MNGTIIRFRGVLFGLFGVTYGFDCWLVSVEFCMWDGKNLKYTKLIYYKYVFFNDLDFALHEGGFYYRIAINYKR